jgi:hypothetical protein
LLTFFCGLGAAWIATASKHLIPNDITFKDGVVRREQMVAFCNIPNGKSALRKSPASAAQSTSAVPEGMLPAALSLRNRAPGYQPSVRGSPARNRRRRCAGARKRGARLLDPAGTRGLMGSPASRRGAGGIGAGDTCATTSRRLHTPITAFTSLWALRSLRSADGVVAHGEGVYKSLDM